MALVDDLFGLDGKAALVTGAGRGIGRALALGLAGAGAAVACADVDLPSAEATAAAVEDRGGRALPVAIDCADEGAIIAGVATATQGLGGLDVLVNNAGIYPVGFVEQLEAPFIEQILRLNVMGTMLCTREAVKPMKEAGGGAIVNLASITGLRSVFPGESVYAASKAAVVAFTRNSALELAPYGIRVNAIAPGAIRTEGTQMLFDLGVDQVILARQPIKRIGEPDDLVGIVIALASDAGRFVTATTIPVDGGFTRT
ncbi:MAG: SDR family oxidoreductase [Acidimicrobiia bacterium]|nr:SDR family oxidoreductase [Acidimicrobiia bacterium]